MGDCNDGDAQIFPGAKEICNLIDDDCDGNADEGFDYDQDGYLDCSDCPQVADCDCDDSNAFVRPNTIELCDDQIDNNCDGETDFAGQDIDQDGYDLCQGDCDDYNPYISPGSPERCNGVDDDCDTTIDEGWDQDFDGNTQCAGDCNDNLDTVFFGAEELCDGLDNNCDGALGDLEDADGDGVLSEACGGDDCDDSDPSVLPDGVEICDGVDNNCDGTIDGENLECDDPEAIKPGWFCSQQGPQPLPWPLLLIGLALVPLRRHQRVA
jgi:hypothetical protein